MTDNFEFEYDLIEATNNNILSSNDIQNDIFNLVTMSNNLYLYTLNFKQILDNPDALKVYREFETLARNVIHSINGHQEYLKLITCLITCMRYEHGLNKRLLSYCLLDILSEINTQLANEIFFHFTFHVGCWKDLKYFYAFIRENGKEYTSSVVEYSIELANLQLRQDLCSSNNSLSNVAKWIPREKTKYYKLYERLASNYFDEYHHSIDCNNLEQKNRAMNKAKMEYRKCLSSLNKRLDTVQIKQCSQNWQKINPQNVTCRTKQLQINSFLNLSTNSNKMRYEICDRIICSQNFIDDDSQYNQNKRERINIQNMTDLLNLISKKEYLLKRFNL